MVHTCARSAPASPPLIFSLSSAEKLSNERLLAELVDRRKQLEEKLGEGIHSNTVSDCRMSQQ